MTTMLNTTKNIIYDCLFLAISGDPSYSLILGQHLESAGRGLRNWLMRGTTQANECRN
jgi:hypothetical protein